MSSSNQTRSVTLALVVSAAIVGVGCTRSRTSSEAAASQADTTHSTVDPNAHGSGKSQGYIFPGLAHGLSQSPINIRSHTADSGAAKHSVHVNYKKSAETVVNKGHTIEVDYDEGSTITFDDQVYDFKQFHFHTPSEHLIDGVTYPMEMHMVHTLQGQDATYLVIGALFKEGKTNPFLEEFISHIPTEAGKTETPENVFVDINDVFEGDDEYYTYQGSLTTPPYTETVRWGVLKRIHEASPEQIALFNELEGNNARHIQALNTRQVEAQ